MKVPEQRSERAWTSHLIDHVSRVALRVQDVERSLGFYRDIAGLEVVERGDDQAALSAPGASPVLVLDGAGVTAPADPYATGLYHTAIRYPDRGALGGALARLVDAGYRIGASDHWVSEALYADDPDGNGVELYHDRPREQWPPPQPGHLVAMGSEPLDLDALLHDAASSGDGRGMAPRGTDIGHVHLQVADVDETIDCYTRVLGLDLTAVWRRQAAFFSSHGYHHHVGANVWHSRGRGPAARLHAGLDHVVFGVEREELDDLRKRLNGAGYAYEGNDNEILVVDPSGIQLRFASTEELA